MISLCVDGGLVEIRNWMAEGPGSWFELRAASFEVHG